MATSAQLSSLITSITSLPSSHPAHGTLQKKASRFLQRSSTTRVDQFAVQDRLSGLEERWRISSEDEVADALSTRVQRLHEIESDGAYAKVPECLQLLLSLSTGQPNLHFEEDLADGRLSKLKLDESKVFRQEFDDDDALWTTIDYRGGDSDDESISVASGPAEPPRKGDGTDDSSIDHDEPEEELLYVATDDLDALVNAKYAHVVLEAAGKGARQQMSEVMVIREAINMLHGLPTWLFNIGPRKQVSAVGTVTLINVSADAARSILDRLASVGSKIVPLRAWVNTDEQSPTLRRFQASVGVLLRDLSAELQDVERAAIMPEHNPPTVTTLLSDLSEMVHMIDLLGSCLPAPTGHNREVRLLNNIARTITEQEAVGAQTGNLTDAFIQCFETYWRPVESWLQGGNIACDGISFVHAANEKDLPLDGLWRGLFDYTYTQDGAFEAPTFLQSFMAQFMTVGKTAYMLDKLGQKGTISQAPVPDDWLGAVLNHDRRPFEPFEDCLKRAIETRLSMSGGLSKGLLSYLHGQWAFRKTIVAIELVYLARVGSINDKAHSALFNLIDRSQYQEWQDQYILTGIFQDAFSDVDHLQTTNLTASFVPTDRSTGSRSRSLVKLEAVRLNLTFAWPLANIIDAGAISILQNVTVLLMQVARAKDVLNQYAIHFNPHLVSDMGTRRVLMSLHQRLRWFVNTLHSYLAFDILSSASSGLSTACLDTADFDTVIKEFKTAMESLERGCLLSEDLGSTHQAVVSILDLAIILTDLCLRHRPGYSNLYEASDSSDDDRENTAPAKQRSGILHFDIDPDSAKLRELSSTFHQLLTFVQAGVREASRLESDRRLELFADDLELELRALKWVR